MITSSHTLSADQAWNTTILRNNTLVLDQDLNNAISTQNESEWNLFSEGAQFNTHNVLDNHVHTPTKST